MTRATYALSLLLILIGGASITVGYPQVQLERGWAAVISGAVAASAGCVTFALGGLLGRLDAIRGAVSSLSATLSQVTAASDAAPVEATPAFEPAVTEARFEDREPAEPEAAESMRPLADPFGGAPERASPETMPLASREVEVTEPFPFSPALPPNEPSAAVSKRPSLIGGSLPRRAAPREEDASRLFSPPATTVGPVAPAEVPDIAPPRNPAGADRFAPLDFDHRPFEQSGSEPLRPTYAEDAPEEPHASQPSDLPVHAPFEAEVQHPPEPQEPVDHPLRPSVVGRYTAGSASYVMYSNGMIEVETENGVHQFESMRELKQFIENQESARV